MVGSTVGHRTGPGHELKPPPLPGWEEEELDVPERR
ncbi:hypothetical protein SSBG_06192 [Streptomyces sp. SPB074]|nr:hypothetical protein SSBG_06192 [Streptomyces sp. SPB074]